MTATTSEKISHEKSSPTLVRITLDDVRHQMAAFANDIEDYLNRYDADVEKSKFSAEKRDDGLEVEIEIKALMHPKPKA